MPPTQDASAKRPDPRPRAEPHADTDTANADLLQFPATETGDAERTAARFGNRIRYSEGLGFLVHDGRRYVRDPEQLRVTRLILRTQRELYGVAGSIGDTEERRKWANHAIGGERRARLTAAAALLRTLPSMQADADEFDANPDHLNVLNGTLDLSTGRLKPHDPADLQTKLAPVTYDSTATAPTWERFINEIFNGDTELTQYVQRILGYYASGYTTEEIMAIFYGLGANGKSTLIRALIHTLGDYVTTAQFETFAVKRNDSTRNDIAALHTARIVTATEGESQQRLAEGFIKQATGRDRITARFLYSEPFTFTPRFKIVLVTNHKPVVRGTDDGIWRRLKLVPFAITIPPERRDPHLDQTLQAEAPGILNWILTGNLMWRQDGLNTATAVEQATTTYRRDSDTLHDFLTACCDTTNPNATTTSRKLHTTYQHWCEANGEEPLSANLFGRLLTDRGHPTSTQRIDGRATKVRAGLTLRNGNRDTP